MSATALTDPITFQTTTMPVAYLGEAFSSTIAVLGGVGPYSYRVVAGSLPPGIRLSGTSLSGTPTTAGAYQFTVEASDANLSTRIKQYTLNVNDLPPLSLEPELPSGQVRGETRVPIRIKAARKVRATRLVWDLGKDVKVTRVQATDPGNAVIWSQDGQVVTVDLGFKTIPRSDTRVALLTVKPGQPATLSSTNFWFESRDGQGKLLSGKKRPVPEPLKPIPPATTPLPTDQSAPVPPNSGTPATGTSSATPATASPATGSPATGSPSTGSPATASPPSGAPSTTTPSTTTQPGATPLPATLPATPAPNPNSGGIVK